LTTLAASLPGVRNFNVAVREWQEQVVFLHKILPGAADKSYGIHVARLAGVPLQVVERAKQILAQLENEQLDGQGQSKLARKAKRIKTADLQLTLFAAEEHPLVGELRELNLDETTPLAALERLQAWQSRLRNEADGRA
jgi:DNA mismatch repair protein MutS